MTFALILLTLNASKEIPSLFNAIAKQTTQPNDILVIDSSSTDNTRELLSQYPAKVHIIPKNTFDHGGTRQLGVQLIDADIYLFLTQDAIPAHPECFENMIQALLQNDSIGCAFGRQIPHVNANPLSRHARLFNYPPQSIVKNYEDKKKYGVKTYFNSNSFAAYKKTALQKVGGFPSYLMLGEDNYVAAKMLMQGYSVHYTADACVYHSHNFNLLQEFHRYFSIGISHRDAHWLIEEFGTANSEGFRFILSELNFLIKNRQVHWIFKMIPSTLIKYVGYKLGLNEKKIPLFIKKRWGINPNYWITYSKNGIKA